MRILTHNSLKCLAKDVIEGFPLQLEIEDLEIVETELNENFLKCLLPGLNWTAIDIAAQAIGLKGIPDAYDPQLLEDKDFLRAMHNLLFDIHIIKGFLVCPESGRRFPIENRIPDMMIQEADLP
mmetsp:Transcript_23351/g.38906  ORF Transcript_23351/g.38906 Transcript_23351/m.38906 type:complete len:124 (-) Transcript_23351:150-521(-)|eukprot:CAMPEP_0174977236 /NCGR_PEP_ID=MMETSP0004_2-20121128/13494_1 /TAXON_ID=420556 /ORGANISM="Ochromonas sp., Strain CCMP1393" /LENGTH=123 /DNA_ID=CAMNT_0016228391 /DNA_START=136 /DNA_END=507 /DNA_ORIENTATION=+